MVELAAGTGGGGVVRKAIMVGKTAVRVALIVVVLVASLRRDWMWHSDEIGGGRRTEGLAVLTRLGWDARNR